MSSEDVKKANQTRAQRAKAAHTEKSNQRKGEQQSLKAEYLKARDGAVLKDILEKSKQFSAYHITVGRDGVGADADGKVIYFTNEKRVSEFDRSAGIQEIINYIERQIADPLPEQVSPLENDLKEEDNKALA